MTLEQKKVLSGKNSIKIANILLGLFIVFDIFILYSIKKNTEKNEKSVSVEKVVELGLALSFYPEPIKKLYADFMRDDQLSVIEEKTLRLRMEEHDQILKSRIGENNKKNANKTDLDIAQENLAAFDKLADDLFDQDQKNQVRGILVEKINQLSQAKN